MKKISLFFCFALFVLTASAQTDGLSFQAIIIDNNAQEIPGVDIEGNYLSEGKVDLRFSIIGDGLTLYSEVHQTTTDRYGMVSLTIGQGEMLPESSMLFTEIDWDGEPKQLVVELAYEGEDFQEFSNQELLFIPYAYHRNITATGTLDVDGETTLNNNLFVTQGSTTNLSGDLTVDGITTLNNNLFVTQGSSTNLSGDLTVDGITTLNNQFVVANGSSSTLTGLLTVEGESDFNAHATFTTITVEEWSELIGDVNVGGSTSLQGSLDVLNNSPTNLSGSLNVEGDADFGGHSSFQSISVADYTDLNGSLDVAGATTFQSPLSVLNGSQASFSGNVGIENELSVGSRSNLNGRVTIDAFLTGGQSNYNAYPLRVQGSDQGISIKVNGGRQASKNFISFMDGGGTIHGRIEGQTLSELQNSFRFIWDVTFAGLDQAFVLAEGIACSSQFDVWEAGVMVVNNAALGAQWVELTANYENNVGVAFATGGADYAEWLEKSDPLERFQPGEVVGVKSGKISKITLDADHIMVVSTNPIVLGNMPPTGEEQNYEKIAFIGQAPVRVVGAVSEGDYLVASGRNDGLAMAFRAESLPSEMLGEILGVAWQNGSSEIINTVNAGIGIKNAALAERLIKVEDEIAVLKSEIAALKAAFEGEDVPEKAVTQDQNKPSAKSQPQKLTEAEFEVWLEKVAPLFEATMGSLKSFFIEQNIKYSQYSDLAQIIDEPKAALRKMYQGEFMASLWEQMEVKYRFK